MSFGASPDLFDSLLEGHNWKLTVLKVQAGRPFHFSFSFAKVVHYEVHFVSGRAYICPGSDVCPVCDSIGKRTVCIGFTGHDRHVGMLEWGLPTQEQIDAERRKHNIADLLGTGWLFERKLARRPSTVRWTGLVETKGQPILRESRIIDAIARVYNLPPSRTALSIEAFAAEVRSALIEKLKRAVYL
jgi:hypothetical protein